MQGHSAVPTCRASAQQCIVPRSVKEQRCCKAQRGKGEAQYSNGTAQIRMEPHRQCWTRQCGGEAMRRLATDARGDDQLRRAVALQWDARWMRSKDAIRDG